MANKGRLTILLAALVLLGSLAELANGKVLTNREEALKKAFPTAQNIVRLDVFLSDEDVQQIEKTAGRKPEGKLFTFYRADGPEGIIGYALIRARILRTMPAVVMLVIRPDGQIGKVELLANHEPETHIPGQTWFDRFIGRVLDDRLWPRKDIPVVSGATISVEAITREIRLGLAVFALAIARKAEIAVPAVPDS